MLDYIVILGFAVNICVKYVYIKDTVQGKNRPNRISYGLWSMSPLIAAAAAFSDGVTWAALPVFATGFCCLSIFLASFLNKNALWKLSKFDWVCGAFALLALVLWRVTNDPSIAIFFSILSVFVATLPMYYKAWIDPHSESYMTYIAGAFNSLTGFFAFHTFTFSEMAYPVCSFTLCSSLALLFYFRRRYLAEHREHSYHMHLTPA